MEEIGISIGMGIVALATGLGIAILAAKAAEGTARQPEAAGPIRTTMLIAAVLIEAIALYGFVINILLWTKI